MNAKNPFTVTSSWMTEDLSRHFDYNAGDILVKVSAALSDFDQKFSNYEASEIVQFEFDSCSPLLCTEGYPCFEKVNCSHQNDPPE